MNWTRLGPIVLGFAVAGCVSERVDSVEPAEESLAVATAAPADGPRYQNGQNLVFPVEYRDWPFLGAGVDLTYQEASPERDPVFTNVFVNPSAHRDFLETGTWPDGSLFVLEARASDTDAAPNTDGLFQGGLLGVEAEVKDSRFPDGWAFFDFGDAAELADVTPPLEGEAVRPCIECHTEHTAVERTFVQFYPTLMAVAREKGTVKPGF